MLAGRCPGGPACAAQPYLSKRESAGDRRGRLDTGIRRRVQTHAGTLEFDRPVVQPLEQLDPHLKRLTGLDEAAVLERSHAPEHHRKIARPLAGARLDELASSLDHRFQHQHAGQNRERREVVLQILLGSRDLLARDKVLVRSFQHSIDEREVHG